MQQIRAALRAALSSAAGSSTVPPRSRRTRRKPGGPRRRRGFRLNSEAQAAQRQRGRERQRGGSRRGSRIDPALALALQAKKGTRGLRLGLRTEGEGQRVPGCELRRRHGDQHARPSMGIGNPDYPTLTRDIKKKLLLGVSGQSSVGCLGDRGRSSGESS